MENYHDNTHKKVNKILIIGAGFVGMASGIGLSYKGHDVTFLDISQKVIDNLRKQGFKAYMVEELPEDSYDFIFICLPTPYDYKKREQDMSIVMSSVNLLAKLLINNPIIALKSTVLPGTSRKLINRLEEITNKKDGRDFYFCTNPEFLRARSAIEDFLHPWIVVIGSDNIKGACKLAELYKDFINEEKIYYVNLEEAEFVKYTHNIFNAMKISFTNQIWLIARELGLDGNKIMSIVAESAEGSWNKRYGIRGGMPYGGLCLPKDTKGFLAWLKKNEIDAPLIASIDMINDMLEEMTSNYSIISKDRVDR
ncbi:MAG: hypothetical protein KatS3mg003_1007 [Candidatus Nitrosocaldaceae archaeon]|nr:MAG: hypothetical protein KatS3mg003_1007 [Candidatus Nitrosocaldaceae archaeon]